MNKMEVQRIINEVAKRWSKISFKPTSVKNDNFDEKFCVGTFDTKPLPKYKGEK